MSPKPPPRPGRPPAEPEAPAAGRTSGPRRPPADKKTSATGAPQSGVTDAPTAPRAPADKPTLPGPRSPRPRRGPQAPREGSAGPITSSVRFKEPRPTPSPKATGRSTTPVTSAGGGGATPAVDVARAAAPTGTQRIKPVRKARPDPSELLPSPSSPRTAFRKRYGVFYDTQGPRIRIGVLWAVAVTLALAFRPLRPYGLATLYAVVAGAAALQVVDAWHTVRSGADRWVAALGASTLPVLATLGVRPLGVGLLALVAASLATAAVRRERQMSLVSAAGHTVLSAGLCGMAAASMVLLADYEIGAVIILVVMVMVYDAWDYVVGSGANNGLEGPIAGGLFIFAVTAVFAVTNAPPFRGADIWTFAVLAAIACPAGQILASAMLPSGRTRAPALRRLDSLLIVAPAWAGLVGLYLQRVA